MIYDDVPGRDNLLKWMERHLQYNTWRKTREQTGNGYMMLYGNHETCRNHEKLGHCIAHTFAKYSIVPVKVNKYYMEMWWNVVCVSVFLDLLAQQLQFYSWNGRHATIQEQTMITMGCQPCTVWSVVPPHIQIYIYACQSESSPHIPNSIYWIFVSMFCHIWFIAFPDYFYVCFSQISTYMGGSVVGISRYIPMGVPQVTMGFVKLCHYVIVIHDDWMIWGYAHDLGTPHNPSYIFLQHVPGSNCSQSAEAPISAQGPHCKLKAGKPAPSVKPKTEDLILMQGI